MKKQKPVRKRSPLKEVADFVARSATDRVTKYIRAGRAYQALSLDALNQSWCAATKDMADDPFDADKRELQDQLTSEFKVRGIEPPVALAQKDIERFCLKVSDSINQMRESDPDGFTQADEELENEFARFVARTRAKIRRLN